MIQFDGSSVSFNPPSLNFEHNYTSAILIFDDIVWEELLKENNLKIVRSKTGKIYENFREYNQNILLVYPNTGASAAVIDFELLIASGIKKFIAFGTCGVFDTDIPQNSIIIPTFAVREEGTSYHYLSADAEVKFTDGLIGKMLQHAQKRNLTANTGGIWTTDAVYRGTENKINTMKTLGCIGVDMELSALMAVAQYRNVNFAQFLIVDDLVPPKATPRRIDERNSRTYLNLAIDILNSL